ncbi:MAG: hypothetical protein IBX52_02365 [Bacterioplanes sp.]|nr:hypothetical protein [Bacterioplanes sp.]
MKNCIFWLLAIGWMPYSVAQSMQPLADDELQATTGQAGMTVSARYEFGEDTRVSYVNEDADYVDTQRYWLVIDNITGAIEFKNLKIDLISNFGAAGNKSAIQITLPETLTYSEFKTDGVYLGPGKEVSNDHRFIMGLEIDGQLQFPAQTTMNIFSLR